LQVTAVEAQLIIFDHQSERKTKNNNHPKFSTARHIRVSKIS